MKIQKKNPQNNIVLHKNQYNESTEKNLFNLMKLQSTMRGWQIYLKNWFDVTIYIHVKMQIWWANSCSELQKVKDFLKWKIFIPGAIIYTSEYCKVMKKLNIDLYIWNTKHWFICMKYYTLIFAHTWCTVWHTDWSFRQVKKWSARIYSASLKNIKIKCGSLCI